MEELGFEPTLDRAGACPGDRGSALRDATREKRIPPGIASPSPFGTSKPSFPLVCLGPPQPVRPGSGPAGRGDGRTGLLLAGRGRAQAPGTGRGRRTAEARTLFRINVFTKGKPSPFSTMD